MISDFLTYQAQTTPHPLMMQVSKAKGSYIYDHKGIKFLDFVAGVSACPLGHCHPVVVEAVQKQAAQYMHVMVYGEYIQNPAVKLSKLLAKQLPDHLRTTYLVNSGTEAIEGALKLAKIVTSRSQIIAAHQSYHGNTQGSMSIMGYEARKQPFRPLLPDVYFIQFNNFSNINHITERTAAVVLETIQGGAGIILPKENYLKCVRRRCDEVGALLILDEIQPGFGRTSKLFAFEHYQVTPDILVMGKGMAGGMPIGAFTSSKEMMSRLSDKPKLGHITTFGGHPVIAAAALATLTEILQSGFISSVNDKERLFREKLVHPLIKEVRGRGLMLCLIFDNSDIASRLILKSLKRQLILFWLLFESRAVRISPPLNISSKEIEEGCQVILEVLDELSPLVKE